jgi:hypothetical protein
VFFSNVKSDQFYGSSGSYIRNFLINKNIWANHANGTLLIGGIGSAVVSTITVTTNVIFNDIQNTRQDGIRFYQNACTTCTFTNNYVIVPANGSSGDVLSADAASIPGLTESGNEFYGPNPGVTLTSQFTNSTFATSDSSDYVLEVNLSTDSHRFLVAIDNDGGGVSLTPESCNSGQWLLLRDIMDYSKDYPDYAVRCGAGAQTLPLAYYGDIKQPIGGMPDIPDTPQPFPFHTGSTKRVFLASVSDQCIGPGCPEKIQARGVSASGGVIFR